MQPLQSFLCFPEMARVGYGISFAIGQELLQAHIDTSLLAGRDVLNVAFSLRRQIAHSSHRHARTSRTRLICWWEILQ